MKLWMVNIHKILKTVIEHMEDYGDTSTYVLLGITEEEVRLTLDEAKEMKAIFDNLVKK